MMVGPKVQELAPCHLHFAATRHHFRESDLTISPIRSPSIDPIPLPLSPFQYVLVNLAYFAALDPREILDSDAVAVSFAERVMGSAAGMLMPICVACACVGSLNGVSPTGIELIRSHRSIPKCDLISDQSPI